LNSLEAEGKEKPLISFHTIDPNINGLNILGNHVTIKNLRIVDDYNPENDILYGKNNLTSGNTIGIGSPEKNVKTLLIIGCDFMGSTSSSYIASSQTRSCVVNNCSFSGYMADHAVYCSMCAETFEVQNCYIKDVSRTTGLFKIRTSSVVESFILSDIKVHNLNGYLARISLLETPTAKITFQNITVSKDSDNNSTFYGFCITDETESDNLDAISHYNVGEITISNSTFGYGYNGESLIYPGSEKKVRAKKIKYINVDAVQSNFGGGISDELIVEHCSFKECTDNQGILIASRSVLIDNTSLSRSDRDKGDNLFLINYSDVTTKSFCLNNVDFNMNVGNLFKINKGEELDLTIDNCRLPNLSGNLFFASRESVLRYKINNTKSSVGHFKEKSFFMRKYLEQQI